MKTTRSTGGSALKAAPHFPRSSHRSRRLSNLERRRSPRLPPPRKSQRTLPGTASVDSCRPSSKQVDGFVSRNALPLRRPTLPTSPRRAQSTTRPSIDGTRTFALRLRRRWISTRPTRLTSIGTTTISRRSRASPLGRGQQDITSLLRSTATPLSLVGYLPKSSTESSSS
jgi:hypothetical protein